MISVAIVSPYRSLQFINEVIEKNDFDCSFHRYIYNELTDIDDIYRECRDKCDVIFFSGELGYHYIRHRFPDIRIPCAFTGYGTTDILAILLLFSLNHPDIPPERLYIDFLTPYNNFMELPRHLPPEHLPYFFNEEVYDYAHITHRAQQLWESGRIDMVLTRSINNLPRFEQLGIPYQSVFASAEMIRSSIARTLDDLRLQNLDSQEHLSVFIRLPFESSCGQNEREYRMATLHKLLVDYRLSSGQDFVIRTGLNQYNLLCTLPAGSFGLEKASNSLRFLLDAADMPLRVGIGLHADEDRSLYYAEQALLEAVRYGRSDGFFIGPDGLPSAPLLSAGSARARGGKVTRFARTNGISEKNLLRLVDLFRAQPDTVLTAALLSQRLGVTPRSASRILLKLGDLGLVSILPDRRAGVKGRPVRCYSFAADLFRQTFL